jgi:hypothetical protein
MSKQKADEILDRIQDEQGGIPFSIRFTPTEREQLGIIARNYKRPMGVVVQMLLHQAIVDYQCDGEILALSSY